MDKNIIFIDQEIRNFITKVRISVDLLKEDVLESDENNFEEITESFDAIDLSLAEYPHLLKNISQYLLQQEVA